MSVLKRINIREIDETSAGSAVVNSDVVFIPGFSAINDDKIIADIPSATPASYTRNTEKYFYNRADKKIWTWTVDALNPDGGYWKISMTNENSATQTLVSPEGTTITVPDIIGITSDIVIYTVVITNNSSESREVAVVSVDVTTGTITLASALTTSDVSATVTYGYGNYMYTAPTAENTPVLCETIAEFEAAFGATPKTFTTKQEYPSEFSSSATGGIQYIAQTGDFDKGYVFAKELLYAGLPVLYTNIVIRDPNGQIVSAPSATYTGIPVNGTIDAVYAAFKGYTYTSGSGASLVTYTVPSIFSALEDTGEYNLKYITSGGYPVFEYDSNSVAILMMQTAANRGDAVAIIDHVNNPVRPLTGAGSVYDALTSTSTLSQNGEFGTMFTPWASYVCNTVGAAQVMPASFGYFLAMGNSLRTNANWLAIAGVSRGIVPNIISENTLSVLSNKVADSYQSRDAIANINAITNIKPYGLTIWGNRTLKNNAANGNLVATSFLNIRNMVSDIKKVAYVAAKSLLFEQNNDILWINFCSKIMPTLNKMNSGAGVSGYKIIKGTTDEKGKVVAIIKIYPVYAVEEFDITVVISDEEVTVS